jgi:deazaflavin-dependent oxidoreductase (nitroreductase family)
MSENLPYLYLTTTGWKTGNAHEIEIWFVALDGRCYLVAEHRERAHWVRNIQHQPAIRFRVGEQTYDGTGRTVIDVEEPALAGQVKALMDRKYQWSDGLIVELAPSGQRG